MFRLLKCTIFTFALAVLTFALFGCTQVSGEEPIYIYGIGLDAKDENVSLYVLLAKDDGGKEDGSGSGSSGKGGGGQSTSGQEENGDIKNRNYKIMTFDGKNAEEVFGAFFGQFKDVYTGTNKMYAVGENMTEKQIWDFKIYLTNSNKLPAKRDTVSIENPYGFLEENAEKLIEK